MGYSNNPLIRCWVMGLANDISVSGPGDVSDNGACNLNCVAALKCVT